MPTEARIATISVNASLGVAHCTTSAMGFVSTAIKGLPNVRATARAVAVITILAFALLDEISAAIVKADSSIGTVDCSDAHMKYHNPKLIDDDTNLLCFEAYISKFGPWPILESGDRRPWGIPQWTIHRVDKRDARSPPARGTQRPRNWFTVPALRAEGVAPTHEDYQFPSTFRKDMGDWFDRGHLAQKHLAERFGGKAGWFTHNVVNAVPQRSKFNSGAWLALECYTGAWANESQSVWIVTGPVFVSGEPKDWLQSNSRGKTFPIAIPDFLFKVVARRKDEAWEAMAFLYAQEDSHYTKGPWTPARQLVPLERVEWLTGLKFADDLRPAGKSKAFKGRLWEVKKVSFDPPCKRFAEEVL